MSDYVQNINIHDIILSEYHNEPNNDNNLASLIESIKRQGITEPLLVRPKNGKYEIVLGNKRYKAAVSLGLNSVPAIIKNIDDEVVKQYMFINDYQNKQNSNTTNEDLLDQPKATSHQFIKTNNSSANNITNNDKFNIPSPTITTNLINANESQDIINLSELDKKEYERNDFIMNNEQLNNNLNGTQPLNNNPVQEPTFGGRFFPSLEDEPTNMSMGSMPNSMMLEPNLAAPVNNLIDLTDTSIEKEAPVAINNINPQPEQPPMTPDFNPSVPNLTTSAPGPQFNNIPTNDFVNPEPTFNNIPPMNEVPVDNLATNLVPPVPEINPNNVMPMSNQMNDFNMATPMSQAAPQFDMSQNIAPQQFGAPQNMEIPSMEPQNNFGMNPESVMPNNFQGMTIPNNIQEVPVPSNDFITIPNMNPEVPQMALNEVPAEPLGVSSQFPQKEVMPVVNTLKSVAKSLEEFGYKIILAEEDSANAYKIVIEIEK